MYFYIANLPLLLYRRFLLLICLSFNIADLPLLLYHWYVSLLYHWSASLICSTVISLICLYCYIADLLLLLADLPLLYYWSASIVILLIYLASIAISLICLYCYIITSIVICHPLSPNRQLDPSQRRPLRVSGAVPCPSGRSAEWSHGCCTGWHFAL